LQAVAAGWHHKSAGELARLADRVGRRRICVMHGTGDRMITYPHAEVLRQELGEGVRFETYEGKGHVLMWEERDAFNRVVEEMVEFAMRLNEEEEVGRKEQEEEGKEGMRGG
jgi:pimeloyl-ACP methyl ester carboxylesterase